jgi:predicted nucleic acid-binding protein
MSPVPEAVFDTNVVVSGFLTPHGSPGRIVDWLRDGSVIAVVDDRIALEYQSVLFRPEFALPTIDVESVLAEIFFSARMVDIGPDDSISDLPDPDDAPFAECAAKAQCPLATGNKRHYPRRVVRKLKVLTSREFLDETVRMMN